MGEGSAEDFVSDADFVPDAELVSVADDEDDSVFDFESPVSLFAFLAAESEPPLFFP